LPAGSSSEVQLSGAVASLDTTKSTFMIGAQLVDYSHATVTGMLANSTPVEVVGTLAGTTLSATQVSVDSQDAEENNEDVEFDGMVSALDTTAKTFKLGDKTIDYSAVSNPPTLNNGAEVKVQGAVDATNASLVHATDVTVEQVTAAAVPRTARSQRR